MLASWTVTTGALRIVMRRSSIIKRPARALARDRSGAAAVEFAIVAAPFLLLMMAILEVALFFTASSVIENGVVEAARDIRTGRFQADGSDEADFRADLCARVSAVADCGKLAVDVRTFDDFSGADFTPPVNEEGGLDDGGFTFEPGGAGDVVVVRVFYEWQLFMPSGGLGIANMAGNKRLISGTTAFRNEPFDESRS